MKKILIGAVLFLFSIALCDTVGYIDSQQILKQYNKAVTAQADLAKKQKDFQDFFLQKQQELEKAKATSKNEEELTQLKDSLEAELQPKRDELLQLNQKLSGDIEKDIIEATKKVAKQLRIDIVLDKQIVISGGMDLTSLVISSLNK
ncbi:MAG: OmpH family outer membrane protein [Candidatus Margulisbacteria bacterium]|nr:OmpH family outer membrane protein [Candidatus Margulisiibacteriota bacterium]